MKAKYIFSVFFFVCLVVLGHRLLDYKTFNTNEEDYVIDRYLAGLSDGADSALAMVPEAIRAKMDEYLIMVGLSSYNSHNGITDAGGSNAGIVAYNTKLLAENTCFSSLVESFYLDLAKLDLKAMGDRSSFANVNDINSLAETTINTGVSESVIWDFAIKKAGGDPNLAMSLIGVCGHDNTEQLEGDSYTSTCTMGGQCVESKVKGQKAINDEDKLNEFFKYNRMTVERAMALWKPTTVSQKKYKEESLKYFASASIEDNETGCPNNSSIMYLQGSLGEETLLSKDLVNEIAKIQAPNKGASVLPGKYYHTIGAAVMTCSLVREGVPSFAIRRIQSTLINTYRMTRLCEQISDNRGEDYISKMDINEILESAMRVREDKSICVKSEEEDEDTGEIWYNFDDTNKDCRFLDRFKEILFEKDIDESILKSKFLRRKAEINASNLFKDKVASIDECSKIQITKSNINKMKEVAESKATCLNITSEDCQSAKDVLKTWWVDFEWSEAQHLKGAEFAINNCKPENDYLEGGKGITCNTARSKEALENCQKRRANMKPGIERKSCDALHKQGLEVPSNTSSSSEGVE